MIVLINIVLALVFHTSADPTEICSKEENVQFQIYDTCIEVTVSAFQCDFEHVDNVSLESSFNPCASSVKADVFNNVIYLPRASNGWKVKYSNGEYNGYGYGKVTWPVKSRCKVISTIYDGFVDVWTYNNTKKYISIRRSYPDFDLELVKKVEFCDRDMWVTNQNGILVSGSKLPSTSSKDLSQYKNLLHPTAAGSVLELCKYLYRKTEVMPENYENYDSHKLLYMAIGGVLLCFGVLVAIVCPVNFYMCYVLRKMKRASAPETEVYVKLCNLRGKRAEGTRQAPDGKPGSAKEVDTVPLEDEFYVCMDNEHQVARY